MNGFYDFLAANYNLIRGLHIIAVIAWMAGLLYLPRLFAYHTRATLGSEMDETFKTMESKLLGIIMNPAMVAAYVFGLTLLYIRGGGGADWWRILIRPWMATKLAGVVFQTWWHHFLAKNRKIMARGGRPHTERFWRMINELPFLAAIVMVLAVTTEFGG